MLKQNNKSAHNKPVKRSSPSDKKNTDANNSKAPEIKNIQLKILKLRKKNDEKMFLILPPMPELHTELKEAAR